jgi:hypothetical protein
MRLWPIDPTWRNELERMDSDQWRDVTHAYHVGDLVRGRVVDVFIANREVVIDLGATTAVAEWSGQSPVAGQHLPVKITAVLNTTRRVLVDITPTRDV